jgi:hypothetical protein
MEMWMYYLYHWNNEYHGSLVLDEPLLKLILAVLVAVVVELLVFYLMVKLILADHLMKMVQVHLILKLRHYKLTINSKKRNKNIYCDG